MFAEGPGSLITCPLMCLSFRVRKLGSIYFFLHKKIIHQMIFFSSKFLIGNCIVHNAPLLDNEGTIFQTKTFEPHHIFSAVDEYIQVFSLMCVSLHGVFYEKKNHTDCNDKALFRCVPSCVLLGMVIRQLRNYTECI